MIGVPPEAFRHQSVIGVPREALRHQSVIGVPREGGATETATLQEMKSCRLDLFLVLKSCSFSCTPSPEAHPRHPYHTFEGLHPHPSPPLTPPEAPL